MAEEDALPPPRARRGRAVAKWSAILVIALLLLAGLALVGINTDPGRRFVAARINALETASGLDIDIGRIEGSIYGRMVIHDLRLRDPKGTFFAAPRIEVDWRPFAYLKNHIDVRTLVIPTAQLARLPELRPGDPNAPILPDLDIDVGRFRIGRIAVAPAVTGQRHLLSLDGSAAIADGRAQITANAAAIAAPGMPGGDRLALKLDAVPERNRFDVEARLQAPAGGFVARLAGLDQPVAATVTGNGSWQNWQGRAQATLGGGGAGQSRGHRPRRQFPHHRAGAAGAAVRGRVGAAAGRAIGTVRCDPDRAAGPSRRRAGAAAIAGRRRRRRGPDRPWPQRIWRRPRRRAAAAAGRDRAQRARPRRAAGDAAERPVRDALCRL